MRTEGWSRGVAAVGVLLLWIGVVRAQEPGRTAPLPAAVTLDAAFLSAYMWRGQALNDEAVLQPAVTVTKGIFTASVWGNCNLTDRVTGEAADFSEVDVTLSLAGRFGPVGATVGLIEYVFPNQTVAEAAVQGTREVYLALSCPDWIVVPSISVYRDVDEVDGTYAVAGLTWTANLGAKLALTVSGSLGYGDKDYNAIYYGVEENALNDANLGLSLAWKVNDAVTVVPSVQYTTLADKGVKDAAGGIYRDDSLVIGGIKFTWGL